jgi:hypothetical protein
VLWRDIGVNWPNWDQNRIIKQNWPEIKQWLWNNCIGKWYYHTGGIWFERKSDAVHYKLVWAYIL